jgi:CheY-like chemotaxis protein
MSKMESRNERGLGYPHVLIAEDEPLIALDLRELIESIGGTVCGVANCAEEAIELAARTDPDLILIDINLEGEKDGIDAVQQIRRFSDVHVLFVTGNWRDLRARGLADEMVVGKPFLDGNLRQAIWDVLASKPGE